MITAIITYHYTMVTCGRWLDFDLLIVIYGSIANQRSNSYPFDFVTIAYTPKSTAVQFTQLSSLFNVSLLC